MSAERRQPGDRAIRIYPRPWFGATMGLDDKATGFYMKLLARSEANPVIPGRVARECADSSYLLKRYTRDLAGRHFRLLIPEGRDLRLSEWDVPSARWRWFGRIGDAEPIAAVSRIAVSAARTPLPRTLRAYVIARDGAVCGICGLGVLAEDLDIDHIVPVSLGGSDDPENLQVTHASCNRSKGARILVGAE